MFNKGKGRCCCAFVYLGAFFYARDLLETGVSVVYIPPLEFSVV